jgi:hypothetical protein
MRGGIDASCITELEADRQTSALMRWPTQALAHILRAKPELLERLEADRQTRRGAHATLRGLLGWLWRQTAAPQRVLREAAMGLLVYVAELLLRQSGSEDGGTPPPQNRSAAQSVCSGAGGFLLSASRWSLQGVCPSAELHRQAKATDEALLTFWCCVGDPERWRCSICPSRTGRSSICPSSWFLGLGACGPVGACLSRFVPTQPHATALNRASRPQSGDALAGSAPQRERHGTRGRNRPVPAPETPSWLRRAVDSCGRRRSRSSQVRAPVDKGATEGQACGVHPGLRCHCFGFRV